MTKSVTSHARWIGAVLSGLVAASAIWATPAISNSDAQILAQTTPGTPAAAPVSNAPAAPKLGAEQLDALTAPIALYPDALLAQVLMATTFPDDLAAAAAWSKQNSKLTGDDAVRAVASMAWDPSVQSLVAFPQALATMAQKPDWVQDMGQAFLAQPNDVMDSVQRLRNAAYKAGNLTTSSQQKVVVQPAATPTASTTSTIIIEPANPQVVYVPAYNPTTVYGAWPYPTYPPVYMPPPPGYMVGTALMTGLAFGAGIAITNSLWGGCDWGHNDVNVNVNRYNNINVNNKIDASRSTANWDRSTAAANRNRNVNNNNQLRNAGTRRTTAGGANADHSAFRGRDDAQRDQARSALSQRTGQNMNSPATDRVQNIRQGDSTRGNQAKGGQGRGQGSTQRDVSGRAQNVNRDNALRDAGNGNASRQSIERGQQSRNAAAPRAAQNSGPRAGNAGGSATRQAGAGAAGARERAPGAGGISGGGGHGGGGGGGARGGGMGGGGSRGGGGHGGGGGLRR